MTDEELEDFLGLLEAAGWAVASAGDGGGNGLNESFRRRYPRIPDDYLKFLRRVASCVHASGRIWFLCADYYNGAGRTPETWNEFEQLDLEAAGDDERWAAETRSFWDDHLAFLMSARGDYAYLAFRVSGESFGSVVDGYDVDFQGVTDVAPDFDAFVRAYGAALRGEGDDSIPPEYF